MTTLASSGDFIAAMRMLPAGVSLITTRVDDCAYGMAATSVTSVTADPPMLLVCVNRNASCHDLILRGGTFGVNVLAADDLGVAHAFGDPAAKERRFQIGDWGQLSTGAPILKTALVSFDCRVAQLIEMSSHTMVIGEVLQTSAGDMPKMPLVYWDRSYRQVPAT